MQSFSLETALYGRPTAKEETPRWIFSPPQAGKFLEFWHVKYINSLRKNASLEMNFEKKSASRRAISHRDFSELIPLATDFPTGIFNRINNTVMGYDSCIVTWHVRSHFQGLPSRNCMSVFWACPQSAPARANPRRNSDATLRIIRGRPYWIQKPESYHLLARCFRDQAAGTN